MASGGETPGAKSRRRLPRWARATIGALVVLAVCAGGAALWQRELVGSLLAGTRFASGAPGEATLTLPPGFRATVFASGLRAPRFLTFGPDGVLYVAERASGSVLALPDPGHTGKAARKLVAASGLDDPTSLSFAGNTLYVGEASRVTHFTLGTDSTLGDKRTIVPNLPTGGNHVTRTVLVGPDGKLYVSIGSSCNNCDEGDQRRATVMIFNADGGGGRIFAKGMRNGVGLATNPWNSQIWATNNGRDLLGDDTPPDTIYALQDGGNYGWPHCQAGDIIDPDLGKPGDCDGVVQPLIKLQAHSAPLGLAFYNAGPFPTAYRGLFIAFHGSWNRSQLTGYKLVFVPLDDHGQATGPVRDFATGWQTSATDAIGRPVGLAVGPDGALYVSDDKAGLVYRITYAG